jgi:phosphate acetyltransferase
MSFVERQKHMAKQKKKVLVLPEGTEPRTMQAARILLDEGIASQVILLGHGQAVQQAAVQHQVDLNGIYVVDVLQSSHLSAYAQEYYDLRKHKGMTLEQATEDIKEPLRFGAMMSRMGHADAMVAGAENTTGNVLLAGFNIIKTAEGVKSASSCMVMDMPDKKWGAQGSMIFSDCATIPDPTAEQLAEIAIASCESCKTFLGVEPVCALLSFSTKGSAKHPNVDKVVQALEIVKQRRPDLNVDGELQLDAALIPEVAQLKAPHSTVAGKANVLIFPDLQAGNIGYKLVQRLANAGAYGPFLQGFAKPISDLSRGATVSDIVNTCAVVLAQA